MKRIYIIGETKREEQRKFLEKVSEHFTNHGFAIYMPHQHVKDEADVDAKKFYAIHMSFLKSSCMLVADISSPSLRLGIELEKANSLKIPICVLHKKESRVDELVKGMPMVRNIIQYSSEDVMLENFEMYFETLGL